MSTFLCVYFRSPSLLPSPHDYCLLTVFTVVDCKKTLYFSCHNTIVRSVLVLHIVEFIFDNYAIFTACKHFDHLKLNIRVTFNNQKCFFK